MTLMQAQSACSLNKQTKSAQFFPFMGMYSCMQVGPRTCILVVKMAHLSVIMNKRLSTYGLKFSARVVRVSVELVFAGDPTSLAHVI